MKNLSLFKKLFKKYRLLSEFGTLSELGMALAEKGLIYEDSIFSHWQHGDRIPNRPTLLKLIEIFVEKKSLQTIDQANEFLSAAGEGYLTLDEEKCFNFSIKTEVPFQVPIEIDNFSGRENVIKNIKQEITSKRLILLFGPAGVGKTSLAIKLGYELKDIFYDGVLWYRLDTSDVMDILLSIAFALGKNIGHITDKEIRASTVRSLLADKKLLLIFDNLEQNTDIRLLLPNNNTCSVIITSRFKNPAIPATYTTIPLSIFTKEETFELFKKILGNPYVDKNKAKIIMLAEKIGFLPLGLHIFAKEIKNDSLDITDLLLRLDNNDLSLENLAYDNRNLFKAIEVSCKLMNLKTERVFLSLAVFEGKDFSIQAVSNINDLPLFETQRILSSLNNISLIEKSSFERYRIHPMIKRFLRKKIIDPQYFLKAANYYKEFLSTYDKKTLKFYPGIKQESDNVLYIFKKCYEYHYWNNVIELWNPLETLLHATKQLNKMREVYQIVKVQQTGINIYQKILIVYFIFLLLYFFYTNIVFKSDVTGYLSNALLGVLPFTGGLIGITIAKSWGILKSSVGKSVFFLSIGLLSWGSGNIIWAYYNFFREVSVPYPSFADLGYIVAYPLWTIGIIFLPHAIGGNYSFRKKYRFLLLFIPIIVLSASYYLTALVTKSNEIFAPAGSWIKLFFDIAYPISDAIVLTAALVVGISYTFFGGKYKLSIYSMLIGFCLMYISDFLFSYTTTANIYQNGEFVDFVFSIALSLITFGMLGFYIKPQK